MPEVFAIIAEPTEWGRILDTQIVIDDLMSSQISSEQLYGNSYYLNVIVNADKSIRLNVACISQGWLGNRSGYKIGEGIVGGNITIDFSPKEFIKWVPRAPKVNRVW
jgi:hypothetical protein